MYSASTPVGAASGKPCYRLAGIAGTLTSPWLSSQLARRQQDRTALGSSGSAARPLCRHGDTRTPCRAERRSEVDKPAAARDHARVEIAAAITIWALFASFLIFPLAGLPAALQRTAATLLAGELIALGVWHYGSIGCLARPCAPLAEAGRAAAAVDIPLLALALVALAVMRGVRTRSSGGHGHDENAAPRGAARRAS